MYVAIMTVCMLFKDPIPGTKKLQPYVECTRLNYQVAGDTVEEDDCLKEAHAVAEGLTRRWKDVAVRVEACADSEES